MIIYLSCTGNTLWAARQIGNATGERLISVTDVVDEGLDLTLADDERLGFCFPVHGWRPPKILRKLIGRMHLHNADKHLHTPCVLPATPSARLLIYCAAICRKPG